MPELPDLQVISKNLEKRLLGKKVLKVNASKTKKQTTTTEHFMDALCGASVSAVSREGKELIFSFDNGVKVSMHLMREGQLYINEEGNIKHQIIKLEFEDGDFFVMSDFMQQAIAVINPEYSDVPDALSENFTIDYLASCLDKKKTATVKGFLIDQSNMRGIGNAYADEILWAALISPKTKCGKLPRDAIEVLHQKIGDVLLRAENSIVERKPDLISGEIRDFLCVHNKNATESPTGHSIINEKIGGKSTYYTQEQVLYE
ncbi:DNA-formamidopyrimidine glycosylase family protein [Methylomonas sp. 11b]|uniref:DNA-formamidopyrimidine glycosylase family protein n=1 Tax=Methylomonas sp. 11b TaxID=1168169 RepID=UPI000479FFD6|nr:DNA-formamidopyrimidine glycosylase family protein [Methylomonas sp. 11b]OQW66771.1 MAG: hypothetical protein BVN35_21230 [Proteobacteria bacterium ST_bin11]